MKIVKSTQNSKGFTLVEVLICVVIVAFIISPLSYSFISSAKIQRASQSVDEAVSNAERLLNEVENKITKEITEAQLNGNEYLQKENEFEELEAFIGPLDESYNTTHYSYEVALWQFDKAPIDATTGELTMDNDSLKTAYKLYSDQTYKLDASDAENKSNKLLSQLPIQFKISAEQQKLFNDTTKKYVLDASSTDNVIWKTLTASYEDGTIKLKDENDQPIGQAILDSNGNQIGVTIELDEPSVTPQDMGIIELDLSQISRGSYNQFIFKFINKTNYNNIIRVKLNKDEVLRPKILVEGIGGGTPKLAVEYIDTIGPQKNYLVAIIVRELKPNMGQEGKILKKMFDIYSYDLSKGYSA